MDQPTAEELLRRLDALVGEWRTTARAETWSGEGTTTFAWHEGGAHLVQRGTAPDPAPNSLCIIGCDGAEGTYTQLYSDDRGVSRVYAMELDGRTWVLEREGEPFDQRFVGTFSDDGDTITGEWQLDDGAGYRKDFDLVLERVPPR